MNRINQLFFTFLYIPGCYGVYRKCKTPYKNFHENRKNTNRSGAKKNIKKQFFLGYGHSKNGSWGKVNSAENGVMACFISLLVKKVQTTKNPAFAGLFDIFR